MSGSFAPDTPLYSSLSWISSLVVISLCWALTGSVVVTGGAALVGAFAACMSLIGGGKVFRTFFRSFGRAFLPATLAWLFDLVVGGLIAWELLVVSRISVGALRYAIVVVLFLALGLLAIVNVWFWPVLARRALEDRPAGVGYLPTLAKASLLAGFCYLPKTVVGVVIFVVPVLLALQSPRLGATVALVFAVFGMAFCCYLVTLLLRKELDVQIED